MGLAPGAVVGYDECVATGADERGTMIYTRIYIATCKCGLMALNQSRTYEAACHVAQAHRDLNPTKCSPTIFADDVPVAK